MNREEMISRILDRTEPWDMLVVGGGEMAEESLQHLLSRGARRVTTANRTTARAAKLARKYSGQIATWGELPRAMVAADVMISATGAPEPILTHESYLADVAPGRVMIDGGLLP